jgi:hypothetical protein
MLRTCAVGCVAAAAATVLTACGGSGSSPAAAPTAAVPATTSAAPCPTPAKAKPVQWPAKVPQDLPKPPNAHIDDQLTASDGVHIVKFTTPTSLRESVLFVVQQLPKAGYVLGRGDAEAMEADAPFVRGNTRGLVRMLEAGPCQTQWLLATVDMASQSANSPLLTPHTPSSSPSPLPFG